MARYAVLRNIQRLSFAVLAMLLLTGMVGPVVGSAAQSDQGVTTLTGSLTVTSPYMLESRADPYVLLADVAPYITGKVDRMTLPGQQVLAGLEGDIADEASFALSLPIAPQGELIDVAHRKGDGVRLYAVDLVSDVLGDPFLNVWEQFGWGLGVSSVQIDAGVWHGSLVVWAPDDEQRFPTDPGRDEQLFTDDDPVAPIPAGWTVIDLDERSFTQRRDKSVEMPLLEREHALNDLSELGYVDAFDALVDDLRVRYAFNEVKAIDWDGLVAEIRPLVEEAERADDAGAFNLAMMRFAILLGDGHVGVQWGDGARDSVQERFGASVGLTLGETDEGEVTVVGVADGSPAAAVGIVPGARIVRWNGRPVAAAVAGTELLLAASSPHVARIQQLALLPRMAAGAPATVVYKNPDVMMPKTAELHAEEDVAGLYAALSPDAGNPGELPVTAMVLPSGVGYIRVNTFMDDVALMFDSWEWALTRMQELGVPALIVDVRGNGGGWGGMSTYFAGSFTDAPFVLAGDYLADADGEYQRVSETWVEPSPLQWEKPVAVLIDADCASACEIFAAAMAHDPDHLIVGTTPTAGVEAGVQPWLLPDNLSFQASIWLMLDSEGALFLEGAGVAPTLDVPVTVDSLVAGGDVVLPAAEAALIDQLAA